MSDLVGQRGELRATIEIKRAETGRVERFDLVGFVDPAQLDAYLAGQSTSIGIDDADATLTSEGEIADLTDHEASVDQAAVTSTVEVNGMVTTRTYSDGAIQRNVWESEEMAQEFAAYVMGVE